MLDGFLLTLIHPIIAICWRGNRNSDCLWECYLSEQPFKF